MPSNGPRKFKPSPTGKYWVSQSPWQGFSLADMKFKFPARDDQLPPGIQHCQEWIKTNHEKEIETWVFIPPDYDNKSTLFYIPGSASLGYFYSETKTFCAHLCIQLQCRVVAIFHRLSEKNLFPVPNNDIYHVMNYYLETINLSRHRIFLGGYSAGGFVAILTCQEALWCRIPIDWLLLIAPAVNLSTKYTSRIYDGRDKIVKKDFYQQFVKNYVPENQSEIYSEVLSPLFKMPLDYEGFPFVTIVVGENDALRPEIFRFYCHLPQEKRKLDLIENEDHSLPWRNRTFIYKLFVPISKKKNLIRFSFFNDIVPVSEPSVVNEMLAEYLKQSPDWYDQENMLQTFCQQLGVVLSCCIAAMSHLRFYRDIHKHMESIDLSLLLQVCNAINLHYLCTLRDTRDVEQPLVITERVLEYILSSIGTPSEPLLQFITLMQVQLLQHRALQALFDNQYSDLKGYAKSSYELMTKQKMIYCLPWGATLTFLGHAFFKQGDFDEAIKWYKKAYFFKKFYYSENHTEVAGALEDIGNVWREQGKYEAAWRYHFRSLEIKKKYYQLTEGNFSPQNLAHSYRALGDLALLQRNFLIAISFYKESQFKNNNEAAITCFLFNIAMWRMNPKTVSKPDPMNLTFLENHPAYHSSELFKLVKSWLKSDSENKKDFNFSKY